MTKVALNKNVREEWLSRVKMYMKQGNKFAEDGVLKIIPILRNISDNMMQIRRQRKIRNKFIHIQVTNHKRPSSGAL